ncbi:hypothetical protein V2T44_00710 [Serratia ficaria]|uniref:hypothetical protein n=1 Tax=Serratia TaxID=613 RepID=UPI001F5DE1AE|nr:hypothetical protein [Serratia sp. 1D1416]MEE4481489.1 hypothetical protein [Serratia ficaria]
MTDLPSAERRPTPDIATPSGDSVKLKIWTFPGEDHAVKAIYEKYRHQPIAQRGSIGDRNSGHHCPLLIFPPSECRVVHRRNCVSIEVFA